jgi:hypothetical protein
MVCACKQPVRYTPHLAVLAALLLAHWPALQTAPLVAAAAAAAVPLPQAGVGVGVR